MTFDPEKPYNDLPLLPPKAEIETKGVLKKLVAASQFLAELKGYVELLPNKAIIINSIINHRLKKHPRNLLFYRMTRWFPLKAYITYSIVTID